MPNTDSNNGGNGFSKWMFMLSLLLVLFARILSQWLGLYGGVILVCVACFAVVWTLRKASGGFDLTSTLTMFVMYYFLMFGLYGFMNAFGLSHFLGVTYDPSEDSSAGLSSLASVYATGMLLAVYSGYAWARPFQSRTRKSAVPLHDVNPRLDFSLFQQLRISALLAVIASYFGIGLLIFFLGGSSSIGRDPTEVATSGSHGLYWVQALIWSNHWAVVVNFMSYFATKKTKYLTFTALSLPVFLLEFLLSGSKSAILFPLMGFLVVRHYCYRRLNWKTLAALGVIVAIVFAAGYAYRSSGAQAAAFGQGVGSFYEDPLLLAQTIVGRFYGTDSFAIILDSVRAGQPLLYGRSMSDILTWYIPRWFWPEKPLSYSLTFGEEFMAGSPGAGDVYYSPSLPGELYLNFGALGLPFGGFVCGWFLRYLYRKLIEQSPRRIERVVIYSVIAPLAASLGGGPISAILEFIMTRVIIYAIFFWLAGLVLNPRPAKLQAVEVLA